MPEREESAPSSKGKGGKSKGGKSKPRGARMLLYRHQKSSTVLKVYTDLKVLSLIHI